MNHVIGIIILLLVCEIGSRAFFKFSPAVWLYKKIKR